MSANQPIQYSTAELIEFDRLCENAGSRDQVTRITARLTMRKFVEQHGKPKCDAMYAELNRRQAKARRRKKAARGEKG